MLSTYSNRYAAFIYFSTTDFKGMAALTKVSVLVTKALWHQGTYVLTQFIISNYQVYLED